MILLRYDTIGAFIDGVKKHPQQDMKDRGFIINRAEAIPIGDAWVFEVVDNNIALPKYISLQDGFAFIV